ncbi:hypothetical protein WA158_006302 [Blastocystis sp. Blastoise]
MSSLIDGTLVANTIKESIKNDVSKMNETLGKVPGLALILVGNRKDSQSYVRMKKRACENAGMKAFTFEFPEDVTQEELVSQIKELNSNNDVHGILVQLPIPAHLNEIQILESISSEKDVDGLDPINVGKIAMKKRESPFVACTPKGCIALLDYYHVPIEGKHAVIMGRSNLVGMPLALSLMKRDATVTVCNSKTVNEQDITKQADILIVAIGKPQFVKKEWIKEGAVVIDVGINSIDDPNSKKGYKLVGDVDFEDVKEKCSLITPVPGGVGPMTITMLLSNTFDSSCRFYHYTKPE